MISHALSSTCSAANIKANYRNVYFVYLGAVVQTKNTTLTFYQKGQLCVESGFNLCDISK